MYQWAARRESMSHFRGFSLQNITLITEITFQVLAMDGKKFLLEPWSKRGTAKIRLVLPRLRHIRIIDVISILHGIQGPYFVYAFLLISTRASPRIDLSTSYFLDLSTHILNGIIHAEKCNIWATLDMKKSKSVHRNNSSLSEIPRICKCWNLWYVQITF